MSEKSIVILGGGPAGHATSVAFPEALVIEKNDYRSEARNFGPHFLWRDLGGFKCRPTKVLSHIDGAPATDESVRRYREKVGRPDDTRPWHDEYGVEATQYDILEWPSVRGLWGWKVDRVRLRDRVVRVTSTSGDTDLSVDVQYDTLINTLPMPIFWRMTDLFRDLDDCFRWTPVYVWVEPYREDQSVRRREEFKFENPWDRYINWISDKDNPCYRESWHENGVHHESLLKDDRWMREPTHTHYPGKIWSEGEKTLGLITRFAETHGVYFNGRYGSWSYGELLHHTYENALSLRRRLG